MTKFVHNSQSVFKTTNNKFTEKKGNLIHYLYSSRFWRKDVPRNTFTHAHPSPLKDSKSFVLRCKKNFCAAHPKCLYWLSKIFCTAQKIFHFATQHKFLLF
jgi:hypothetical protein